MTLRHGDPEAQRMDLYPGHVIAGKYRLERHIGLGSMGSVWGARHLALDAPVAIKFMNPALMDSALAYTRFEREAKAAAQLRSPHVVQILDHGIDNKTPFIAMEWIEGEDLRARLKRVQRLSLQQAAVIANQAAKALRAAHASGIVHRDLKPGNIFLARIHGEEIVKLLDFGVAKFKSSLDGNDSESTATGTLVGTPNYMSPEQARGSKDLDHRSDLWSLGVILYQAVTGVMPFAGEAIGDILVKICTEPLKPPTCIVFDLPPALDWFFERACARDPARRYQTATELAAAFSAIAEGRGAQNASMVGPAAATETIKVRPAGWEPPPPVVFIPMKETPKSPYIKLILAAFLVFLVLALLASQWWEEKAANIFKDI